MGSGDAGSTFLASLVLSTVCVNLRLGDSRGPFMRQAKGSVPFLSHGGSFPPRSQRLFPFFAKRFLIDVDNALP